jgi:hypothetical protein
MSQKSKTTLGREIAEAAVSTMAQQNNELSIDEARDILLSEISRIKLERLRFASITARAMEFFERTKDMGLTTKEKQQMFLNEILNQKTEGKDGGGREDAIH